jgi:hypothetical protein
MVAEGTTVVVAKVVAVRVAVVEGAENFRRRKGFSSIFLSHRLREANRIGALSDLARERLLPDAKENLPSTRPLGEPVFLKTYSIYDKRCCTTFLYKSV